MLDSISTTNKSFDVFNNSSFGDVLKAFFGVQKPILESSRDAKFEINAAAEQLNKLRDAGALSTLGLGAVNSAVDSFKMLQRG
jgi:hypothetical protein